MAEQKQRERINTADSLESALEMEKKKREKERRAQKFDASLQQLAEKAVDTLMEQGQDSVMGNLMVTFLDVALEMKSMISTLNSINMAMECINDAIGFIDSALDFDQQMISDSLKQNYGFIQRVKQKRQMKKAMRNNLNRVKMIIQSITMKYDMATQMLDGFGRMSTRINKMMKGRIQKQSKKKAAPAQEGVGVGSNPNSPAMKMISQIMEKRGVSSSDIPPSASASGGSAPAPSASKDDGIDDIL